MQVMMARCGISGAEMQTSLTHCNAPKKLLKGAALDPFPKAFLHLIWSL